MKVKSMHLFVSAAIGLGGLVTAGAASAGAIITNGVIMMGVNDEGHLNAPYAADTLQNGLGWTGPIGNVGLRYVPTGAASTEPGCLCEGWGVGLRTTGQAGFANISSDGGAQNLSVVSFTSTANTAVSIVNATTTGLQVTHDYHPTTKTSNLYEVTVSIKNNTGADIAAGDLVYRRVMDWDIYPTPFSEFVTIQGVPTLLGIANGTNVARTDNNGFNSANPFSFSSMGLQNVNFTDAGPDDHGAMFDFEFNTLAAGATLTFNTYYGAAATVAEADAARAAVGMGLYSYGKCNPNAGAYAVGDASACNPLTGAPNTFIFGFGTAVGGGGVLDPDDPNDDVPGVNPVPEPETYAMLLTGLGLIGLMARRRKKGAA